MHLQGDDHPQELPISSLENISDVHEVAPTSIAESSTASTTPLSISFEYENGSSSQFSDGIIQNTILHNGLQNNESSSHNAHSLKSIESVSQPVSSNPSCVDSYNEHLSQEPLKLDAF